MTRSSAEEEKEIHRLFGPKCAVVVEHGDALSGWYKVWRPFLCYRRHEFDNGLLGLAIVPGGERVNGLCVRRGTEGQTHVSKG
ncbi:MAG: hypothetical protein WBM41_05345 [Arenicellales bacterium]